MGLPLIKMAYTLCGVYVRYVLGEDVVDGKPAVINGCLRDNNKKGERGREKNTPLEGS